MAEPTVEDESPPERLASYASAERGGTADWVRIQETTFINWCNELLRKKTTRSIKRLDVDLQDGVLLLLLLETVAKYKFGR